MPSTPEAAPKKQRAKRKNYQKTVESAIAYCEAAIETITAFVPEGPARDGQLDALRAVLKRLTGE